MIRVIEAGERFDPFEPPLAPSLSVSETTSTDGSWTVSWGGPNHDEFYSYVELEETLPGGTASTTTFYDAPGSTSISGKTVVGAYTYRVKGCSNLCSSWSGSLTVTYAPNTSNSRPVVGSISDLTVSRGSTGTRTATVTDGDAGDTHTVSANSSATGVATVSVNGKTLTVRGVSRGTATIEVTARDNSGATNATSAAVEFDVTVPNSRPAVGSISDLTVSRGSTGTRTVTVTDGDAGDTHTVSASSDDAAVTVSVNGRTLTVRGVSRGSATITVTARDNSGESNDTSAAVQFDVDVELTNSQPEVGPFSDRTISRGSTDALTVIVRDADPGDRHTVSAGSDASGVATVSEYDKTLTLTGVSRGDATITVTARDDSGAANDTSPPARFDVTVPNSRPVVGSISHRTVSRGSTATETATVTDGDTGDTHTVRATSDDRSVATVSVSGKRLTVRGVACGTATMRVTARDNSGASNATSAAVTFTATVPNSRPVVGSISNLTVSRGSTGTRTVSVTDGDSGDTPAVSASSSDTGVATVSVSGRRLTVRGVSRGTATITAMATDDCGATGSAEFDVTVPNTRPAVRPISDLTVTGTTTVTVTVTVTDGDSGDTHTVEASSDDAAVTVRLSGTTLSLTGVSRGGATITVTAMDNSGEPNATSAVVQFDVEVEVVNSRPVVGSIPDRTVSRGLTRSVAVTVTDDDADDEHTVRASSDASGVATVSVNGKRLTVRGLSCGAATMTVTATDDSGESNATSAAKEFRVTVPNSRPSVGSISDLTVSRGSTGTRTVSVTDGDSGDTPAVSASSSDTGVATVSVSGNRLTVRGVSRGTATITATATDECGASGSGEFDVTVPNTRPVVGSIPDRTVSRGLTRSVAVTVTDDDADDEHTVRASSDATGVATVSVNGKRLTVRGLSCGAATMTVTATDDSGESNATSAAKEFRVTVPNSRPSVGSISDLTVSRGSTGTRTVSVTDGDSGDTPAVSASSSDTGVATVSVSGRRLTVRGVSRGTATITAMATDDCGATGSAEFDVTVPNSRPVVGSISDLTVSRGSTGTRTVTVTDGDADDTHEVSASSSDEGVATVSVNGKTLTVSGGSRGRATIEVTARDDSGESNDTSAAVRFGVRVPNSRPVVSPIPDKRISRASGGSVTVTVTDADPGDAHTVSARSGDEAVATVDVTGKTLTLESVSSGEATITVTARDDSGESNATSAAVPFEAMVNSPPEVDLIADLTVPPGTSETLAAPVTDANSGDAHTVSAESDDAAVASVEVSGRELTIAGKASGHTMIGVTANDGLDSSAKRTFGVIVNTRPEVDSIADLTVSPGAAGTLTVPVPVTDADAGDAHQVAASSDDTGVATVSVSGEELTLAGVSAGEATITVTAIDDSGGSNAASAPATFAAIVNTLPEVDAIAPQLVETGADLAVAATATDPDAGQAHTFAAESDDTGVATVSVSGAELTLTGVSAGEATITVTATDDSGGSNAESASATFAVTVNARPEVDPIESQLVETDAELAVEVSVTDADASQTQTLTAESDNPGVVTVEVSEDGTELTLVGVSAGEATITVTATDDSGAPNATSEALAFAVTVNDRSELSAISDQTLAPGATATLAVAIADADAGQAHSLAAESDDPAVATVSVSGEELTLTGVSAGAATITVTATDDSQAPNAESEPATFAVIVNSPPEVDPIAPQLVETGEDLAVTTTATDPDGGQEHTLAAESSDAAVATVSVSGMELTLTGVTAGAATITVTAMDDSGGSNAKSSATTFAVTVNARPEVGPIAELTVSPGSAETATVSVTDADSRQTHDLIAESDDPAVATADVSGTELTVTGVASGSASIEVTATDDSEAPNAKSEPATLAVTVNTRPELEPIAGLTIAPSSTETVAATVVDPDAGQTHALAAKTSDAAVATVDMSGTELTLTGVLAGAATITVTATDHSGGSNAESAPATFTAIVNTRPVVEPIGALSIAMDAGTATVSVVVTDPDAGQTPALTAESDAPAVATVEVSEDGTELTLTGVSAGGAMITVTATDDSGGSNAKSEAIIFEVAVSNSRPVVEEPVSDQTLSPGESLTLAVTVTDADAGDLHAVAASSSDDAVATAEVSEDGTELTLTGVSAGEASIEVTATDDSEAPNAKSEPATLAVTVNTRPELEPIAGLTIAPSSTETVAATVVDPDAGQTHALAAKTSDAAVATVDVSGTELTLTGVLAGAATITVTATDHSGGSNAESAPAMFIAIVNTRPVVEPIGALSIAMDAGTATVSVVVTDPDAGQTPALTAESDAPAVATVEVSEDGTELTLTGVSAGGAMIWVTAMDNSGGSNATSEAVAFEVAVSNSRPVVEEPVSDQTLSPGESLTLAVTVTDADAGDLHAVAASSSDDAVATAEVSEDGTELTLTGVSAGEASIEVTATDDSEAPNAKSEPATLAVTVNTRPELEPIAGLTIAPSSTETVAATVVDPDAEQTHALAAKTSDAAVATVDVSGTELTLTGVLAGAATITMTATDDSRGSNAESAPATFTAIVNTRPVVEPIEALSIAMDAGTATVSVVVTDPDAGQTPA